MGSTDSQGPSQPSGLPRMRQQHLQAAAEVGTGINDAVLKHLASIKHTAVLAV